MSTKNQRNFVIRALRRLFCKAQSRRRTRRALRWEVLESRQLLVSDWNNVLQPLNVTGEDSQSVDPLDVLVIINELNDPTIRASSSSPLPIRGSNGKSPPPFIDVDCDNFVTPLDVLIVINAINRGSLDPSWRFNQNGGTTGNEGRVVEDSCKPRLLEGSSFTTSLISDIVIPEGLNSLSFELNTLRFDTSSTGRAHDAFEAALVDEGGRSLVQTLGNGKDAFYNVSEGISEAYTSEVAVANNKVSLSLVDVLPGTKAKLILRLVNNDSDTTTSVTVPSIRFEPLLSRFSVSPPSGNASFIGPPIGRSSGPVEPSAGMGISMPSPDSIAGRPVTRRDQPDAKASLPGNIESDPSNGAPLFRDPPASSPIDSRGKEFWVGFPDNLFEGGTPPQKSLSITGDLATTGYVEIPGLINPATSLPFRSDFVVNPGQVTTIDLPSLDIGDFNDNETDYDVEVEGISRVQRKGVHVVTNDPVSVYGIDRKVNTSDAFLALPVPSLGSEYVNLGYGNTYASISSVLGTQVLAVATQDNTQLTVTPGKYAGKTSQSNVVIQRPSGSTSFSLQNQDGNDIGLVTDQAGTHSISIQPPYEGYAGKYQFNLVDVASAATNASIGDIVNVNFPTGREAKVIAFDIAAGQRLYFDPLNANPQPNCNVSLIAPSGDARVFDGDADVVANAFGVRTFLETGKYFLLMVGQQDAPFNFSFRMIDFDTAPILIPGVSITGGVNSIARTDIYRIDGTAGQTFYYDSFGSNRFVTTTLYGPGGQYIDVFAAPDDRTIKIPETGTYFLIQNSATFGQPTYSFRLVDLKSLPILPLSSPVSTTVSSGIASFQRFAGSAGQSFNLSVQDVTPPFRVVYRVLDPAGNDIPLNFTGNNGVARLLSDGDYTLYVGSISDAESGTITYLPTIVTDPIVVKSGFNTTKTLTITPGGSDTYQFSAPAGTRFMIDGLDSQPQRVYLVVTDPNGNDIYNGIDLEPRIGPILSQSGTYTMTLRGFSPSDAGTFTFRVLDFDSFAIPLTFGTAVNGTLPTGRETAVYSFDANIGDKLSFDGLSAEAVRVRLLDPLLGLVALGTRIDINTSIDATIRIPRSGRYYVTLFGEQDVATNFRFRILNLAQAPVLTFGTEVSGLLTPGRSHMVYRLPLTAGQRIRFDNLSTNSDQIDVSIQDMGGRYLYYRSPISDSTEASGPTIVAADTQDYFVFLLGGQDAVARYRFKIDDFAQAPLLSFDTDLDINLDPGVTARLFRIDAIAGETISLDNLGTAALPLDWRVTGPANQYLGASNDDFSVRILSSGPHYLTLDGYQTAGPFRVRFRATRTPGPIVPLSGFNTDISLDVGIGETKIHNFSAPTGRIVYLNAIQSKFALPTQTVTLNKGDTYLVRDLGFSGLFGLPDLTGSILTSTKPIAVFGGNRAAFVPSEYFAADHLLEQLPPTNTWGRDFVTMPLVTDSTRGDRFRFLAQADNTQVKVNGVAVSTLNRGEYYEQVIIGPSRVQSSAPILVAQYAQSQNYYRTDPGGNPNFQGDPFMMIVPPYEQFLANYTVTTPAEDSIPVGERFDRNFINIVAPAEDVGTIEINGSAIDPAKFVAIGTSGFFGAQIPIELGSYQLAGPLPFGVFVYGFGSFDSYGYVGGQALSQVAEVRSVVLTPATANPQVNNSLVLTARVADVSGAALPGIRVDFDVAGVNPQRGFGFSDANGLVQFSYTGTRDGRDIVTASVGQLLDDSIIDWRSGAVAPQVLVAAPLDGSSVAAGTTLVATGLAIADFPLATLDLVTVNGVPLSSVDAAGNFFVQLFVGPGDNEFEFAAIDSNGNSGSQVITITGIQRDTSKIDFTQFADVTGSFKATYARSSYNESNRSFLAETAVENIGQFPTDAPLLVGIANISDPMILVRDADGTTPDGIPYYDFSGMVTGGTLNPRSLTGFLSAKFYNPNLKQFTYDLVFYGKLNEPPQISSLPPTEADLNREYAYNIIATDPNRDAILFELAEAPAGMTIDNASGQIRWTPSSENAGLHSVEVRVSDSRQGVSSQRFTLSARPKPANRVPVFSSLPVAVADVGNAYPYTAQAADVDGDVLGYRLVTGPLGMTIHAQSGVVQWTPTPQQLGAQPVVIEVADSFGGLAEQSFSLLVLSPPDNSAPVIVSSPPTAIKWSGLNYQVVALDADQEPLTYRLTSAPNGMTISPTGQIAWNPSQSQFGPHSVAIEVLDARGGRASQNFDVAVFDNQDPVITSSPITTAQLNALYSYQVKVTDSVDDLLSFKLIDAPVGMTINASSGLIQWDVTNKAYEQEHVTVSVFDGRGGSSTQQFVVAVAGGQNQTPNINPSFVSSPPMVASVGSLWTYTAQARDPDGDSLTYDLPLSPVGMVIDAATGQLGWLPQSSQAGMQQVVIRVKDGQAGIWLQSFQIDVDGSNTAPVITSSPGRNSASVGIPWEYRLHVQDADGDPLMYELVSPPSGMTLTPLSNSDASALLSFTPTVAGSVEVVLVAKDNRGGRTEQRFAVQTAATAPNVAPTIYSLPRSTIPAGQTWAYLASADDPNGDPITITLPIAPDGMTFDAGQRLASWTPTLSQIGSHSVVLNVSDGRGGITSQSVTLEVVSNSDNATPSIVSPPSAFRATVGEPFDYDLKAADDDNDPVEWTIIEAPQGASLDRRYGTLRWTPILDQLGLQRFVISAKDPLGREAQQSFSLIVSGANLGPSILSRATSEAVADERYVYGVQAIDPENDQLIYSIKNGPAGMTIDAARGIIRWTPTLGQLGTANATVEVTDSRGNKSTQQFQINVSQVVRNREPIVSSRAIFRARVDALYQYDVNAIDPEGDNVSFSLMSAPAGMQIDTASGLITWTPTVAQTGSHLVQVAAQDSAGGRSVQRFAVLARINQAPVLVSQAVESVALGGTYRYDLQVTDPEGDALSYELVLGPTGMTIDSLGRILWQTETGVPAFNQVALRVTDSYGAFLSYVYGLTVTPDTTAPQLELRFSANPVALGQNTVIVVQASDNVGIVDVRLTMNGQPLVLDANRSVTLRGDIAGVYALRATAIDASGNEGVANVSLRVFDPADTQGPTIILTSPQPNAVVTTLTDIVGSITDDNLQFYRIDYGRADLVDINSPEANDPDYKTLVTSNTAAVDKVLATFDPTMLINDEYIIRVIAQDLTGNVSTKVVPLSLDGQLKLGEFKLDFNDLTVPIAGIPITVTRSYDTRNANIQGDFGYGWTLSVSDPKIRESIPVNPLEEQGLFFAATPFREGTKVYLTNPEGRRVGFTFRPTAEFSLFGGGSFAPTFVPDPGVYDKLDVGSVPLRKINGSFYSGFFGDPFNPSAYRLTSKSGFVYEYGQFSGLDNVTDRNGNRLEFRSDGIFSSAGPSIQFIRDAAGRISRIIDPSGNDLTYVYSILGDLVSFSDQNASVTRHSYLETPHHFLDTIVDPRGVTTLELEFDADGKLIRSFDATGKSITQSIDITQGTFSTTDANGNTNKTKYDALGNIVEEENALGQRTTISYTDPRNPYIETKIVQANGATTEYQLDPLGNVIYIADAMGGVTEIRYDSSSKLLQEIDPLGHSTSYMYDAAKRLIARIDANGEAISLSYDTKGRVTAYVNELDNTRRYEHDAGCACGQPSTVFNFDGSKTQFEYNSLGNLTQATSELGEVTKFQYDGTGQRTRVVGPSGDEMVSVFEQYKLVEFRERTDRNTFRSTQYNYDAAGRLIQSVDPLGGVTTYSYDNNGNMLSLRDPLGNLTRYAYDAVNRVVRKTDPLGNVISREYDSVGNVSAIVDRDGKRREFQYDRLNRQVLERWKQPDSTKVYEAEWIYDEVGNLTHAKDDASAYAFSYDNMNRLVSTSSQIVGASTGISLFYRYDAAGNVLEVHDDHGMSSEMQYDIRNRLTAKNWSSPDFVSAKVQFDYGIGNETIETERFNSISAMTPVSRTIALLDSRLRTKKLTNFARGLKIDDTSFDYDSSGQLVSKIQNSVNTRYVYDMAGQLLSVDGDGQNGESYSYDANGNRQSSLRHGNGYVIGPNNRLESDGEFAYQYDKSGRLTVKRSLATGVKFENVYDYRGRLVRLIELDASGLIVNEASYAYDIFDRRVRSEFSGAVLYTFHNGSNAWIELDGTGIVRGRFLFGSTADSILASFTPSTGLVWHIKEGVDSTVQLLDAEGNSLTRYEYDSFGNLLTPSSNLSSNRFLFTGREREPFGDSYYFRTRNYDPNIGRFTSEDTIGFNAGDTNLYRYVGNSPVNFVDPTGTQGQTEGASLSAIISGAVGNWLQGKVCDLFGSTYAESLSIKENKDVSGVAAGGFGVSFGILAARLFNASETVEATFIAGLKSGGKVVLAGSLGGALGGSLGCVAGLIAPTVIEWVASASFRDGVTRRQPKPGDKIGNGRGPDGSVKDYTDSNGNLTLNVMN